MVLGSGVAAAAQKVIGKMAAASGGSEASAAPADPAAPETASVESAKFEHINRGPTEGNRVAFTFDDGPIPGVTTRILDEFKKRQLHATFFMIGQQIAAHPELARRVLAEGHDVGNHTYTHPKLPSLDYDQANAEIQKTAEVMLETMNHRPVWFRPPYGELRPDQFRLVQKHGLRSVFGDVSTKDWSQPGEDKILAKILNDTQPGSIIICHDFSEQTANCLGQALDGLLERGFSPVTLTALLD
jgi:peptidoglycan/xylan/chitin deacetylase (PgdA/CDA1 family)